MIKKWLFLFSIALSTLAINADHRNAVSYETPSGRLGDQLIAYMHAKWISYAYEMPLLYKPFCYSSDLVLDEKEELYKPLETKSYQTVNIETLNTIEENHTSDVLFIAQYFPESPYELKLLKWPSFPINWKDPQFIALLRSLIYPKHPCINTELPADRAAIAVHIRRGGGFDDPALHRHWPLKFPPDSFYIAQIRTIHELLQQPLFVHIFTDDLTPSSIAEHYARELSDIDIIFDYRSEGNSHKANVIDDLFDMMRYQCLIRPESNYSIVAERLGNYIIAIHPTECIIHDKNIVITDTCLTFRD